MEMSFQYYGGMEIDESISVSNSETDKLGNGRWGVKTYENSDKLKEQGFAFKGKVHTGTLLTNETSVMVYCRADADGNPDNKWISEAYIDAMNSDK